MDGRLCRVAPPAGWAAGTCGVGGWTGMWGGWVGGVLGKRLGNVEKQLKSILVGTVKKNNYFQELTFSLFL